MTTPLLMDKTELLLALQASQAEVRDLTSKLNAYKRGNERLAVVYYANQQAQDLLAVARHLVATLNGEPGGALRLSAVDELLREAMGLLFNAQPTDSEGGTVYRHDGDDEIVTDYSPAGQVTAVRVNGALEDF